jgi:hypothetical protein
LEKSLKMSQFSVFVFRTWEGIGHKAASGIECIVEQEVGKKFLPQL